MREISPTRIVTLLGLGLVIGALALVVAQPRVEASGAQQSPVLRIDAQAAGNTANELSSIDQRVELRVGDMVQADIVILNARDLIGFGFDFTYDPLIVHATAVNVHMLLADEPGSSVADFTKNFGAPEDSDGVLTPVAADLAQGGAGSSEGTGVLVRLGLKAVGCGASSLTVRPNTVLGPMLQDNRGELFNPLSIDHAEILVAPAGGEQCPGPAATSDTDRPSTGADGATGSGDTGSDRGVAGSWSAPGGAAEGDSEVSEDPAEESSPSLGQDEALAGDGQPGSDADNEEFVKVALIVGVPVAIALAALAMTGRVLWLRRRR